MEQPIKTKDQRERDLSIEKDNRIVKEYKRENGVIRVTYERDQDGVDINDVDLSKERELLVKDILFIQDDGKEFPFASLLPTGIDLVESQKFFERIAEFNQKRGEICFSKYAIAYDDEMEEGKKLMLKNFFEVGGSLYVMLHEIGHIAQADENEWDRYNQLYDLAVNDKLDDREIDEFVSIVLRMERQAHIFAIKELRRLRKEGIDLEPLYRQLKDLRELVHGGIEGGLKSYEKFIPPEKLKSKSKP